MREELEIYKIYVRTIIATENRRQRAATAYLSIIAAIATVSSIIGDIPLVVPIGAIIFVALIWLATVYYFRRLAKAKFSVISSIEPILPIQPFKEEWKHFKKGGILTKVGLTRLEMWIPTLIILLCGIYLFWEYFRVILEVSA